MQQAIAAQLAKRKAQDAAAAGKKPRKPKPSKQKQTYTKKYRKRWIFPDKLTSIVGPIGQNTVVCANENIEKELRKGETRIMQFKLNKEQYKMVLESLNQPGMLQVYDPEGMAATMQTATLYYREQPENNGRHYFTVVAELSRANSAFVDFCA